MRTHTASKQLLNTRAHSSLRREEGRHSHEHTVQNESTSQSAYASHVSVMVSEVLQNLALAGESVVFDATAGRGGYSYAILSSSESEIIAIDADSEAVNATTERLAQFDSRATVLEGNFATADKILTKLGIEEISGAVFDLGWNANQLQSGRGFSFLHDEPLSMSYGKKPKSGFTAKEIVNSWDEKTIADVIYGYGDEQYARKIASAIVERRKEGAITSTLELSEVVRDAVPPAYRHKKINPATKTFQALRIAVNDELVAIEEGVRGVWKHLQPGGRIVMVTFHSIEDRVVKKLFLDLAQEGGKIVHKKPLQPSQAEITRNPRARSAKLRVIEKI